MKIDLDSWFRAWVGPLTFLRATKRENHPFCQVTTRQYTGTFSSIAISNLAPLPMLWYMWLSLVVNHQGRKNSFTNTQSEFLSQVQILMMHNLNPKIFNSMRIDLSSVDRTKVRKWRPGLTTLLGTQEWSHKAVHPPLNANPSKNLDRWPIGLWKRQTLFYLGQLLMYF